MDEKLPDNALELPELRDRLHVFADRADAGGVLAGMLEAMHGGNGIVLAVPAGGVPVAAALAQKLALPLEVAVVSKITPAFNSEVGYGAVAFDHTVLLNERFIRQLGLTDADVQQGTQQTMQKVDRRVRELRGQRPMPPLAHRSVILVDDGLASGVTMLAAVAAVSKSRPSELLLAVPTAHVDAVRRLAAEVTRLYCPNIRTGGSFAVADAYRNWRDVPETQAAQLLRGFRR